MRSVEITANSYLVFSLGGEAVVAIWLCVSRVGEFAQCATWRQYLD